MKQLQQVLYPPAWSVTVRLSVALLLAALVPMSLIAYYNNQVSLHSLEGTEFETKALLASSIASRLDQLLSDTQHVAKQVSGEPAVIGFLDNPTAVPYEAAALTLDNVLFSNPNYEYVYLMDRTGDAVMSRQLEHLSSIEGLHLKDRKYFQQAMAGGQYIDVLVGRTSRQLGLYFSSPVYGPDGDSIGVAAIKIGGAAVEEVMKTLQIGEQGIAFLIDQDGVIVSHPNPELYYHSLVSLPPKKVPTVVQRLTLSGGRVESLGMADLAADVLQATHADHTSYINTDGTRHIGGFAPLSQLHWTVVVSEPQAEFAEPLNNLARQSGLSVVIVGVVVAVIALSLAQSIARPVRALTHAAQALERDDDSFDAVGLEAHAPKHGDIGQLVRVFIRMAQEVKAREERLKQQVMELRIEIDEVQKEREVARIVDTEYFRDLKAKAVDARRRRDAGNTDSIFDALKSKVRDDAADENTDDSAEDDPFFDLRTRAENIRRRQIPQPDDD
ncbi:MAG: cache and HAMP domain-containing protein [Anaerolineae bacterium]|nr:cache and HAMP domain-containing protein [Anaerolineae bacterium]